MSEASTSARSDRDLSHAERRRAARARSQHGITLIEIMIVLVIVALGASAASIGLGSVTRTNLKSACVRLMSLTRYAYHRALTNGSTVRIALNLDRGTFEVGEAFGRITLVRSDAPLRTEAAREDEHNRDPGAGIDAWELAKRRIEKPDDLTLPPSPFEQLKSPDGKVMQRFKAQPVGDKIRIAKVIVAHEAEAKSEGSTDLFFFPSGLTQHAVIQLSDPSGAIFSVEVHPLTGKGSIHDAPFEPEVLMDDPSKRNDEASQLEDR